jgi:hypothetical protein
MTRMNRALALVLAPALALAPGAAAKGPFMLDVCGSSGCTQISSEGDDDDLVFGLLDLVYNPPVDAVGSAPPPAPYYELGFTFEGGEKQQLFLVPGAGFLRTAATWVRLGAGELAGYERLAAGLEPWPRPELERVRVDGREAADPAPYEGLLGALEPAGWPEEPGELIEIEPDFGRATPWTANRLRYFPADRLLWREDEILRVPEELARAIGRDAGLAANLPPAATAPSAAEAGDGTGFPWALILAVAAGAGLLAGAALLAVGRNTRGRGSRSSA